MNLGRNPCKRINLGVEGKTIPGLGRNVRMNASPGGKPKENLRPGLKGKFSPGLGRKALVRVNLGKRLRRETDVPGGKPKARLRLGVNPEEVVLSPGKGPKVSQDRGRGLRVDLNLGRNPLESLSRGRNRREMLSLGAKVVSVREAPGLKAEKNRAKIKPGVIIPASSNPCQKLSLTMPDWVVY